MAATKFGSAHSNNNNNNNNRFIVLSLLALFSFGAFFLLWKQESSSSSSSWFNFLNRSHRDTVLTNERHLTAVTTPSQLHFEQLAREVRSLAKKCANKDLKTLENDNECITEHCSSNPFGFDGRVSRGHTPNVIGNNCEPWIRRDIILLLNRLVKPNFSVLEWSSGSSTVWMLPRVNRLISVESDVQWANSVVERVKQMGLSHKIQFHIIPPTKNPIRSQTELQEESGENSDNSRYEWAKSRHDGYYYQQYVMVELPQELHGKFDLIIVDGRARSACLRRAVSLLKPEDGLLLLDNSERSQYMKEAIVPGYWPRYVARGPPTETTLWLSQSPRYEKVSGVSSNE